MFTVGKTDIIIINTKQQRNKFASHFPVKLLRNDTSPSDTVRNLDVVFDSDFCFHWYISQNCICIQIMFVISVESSANCLYRQLKNTTTNSSNY